MSEQEPSQDSSTSGDIVTCSSMELYSLDKHLVTRILGEDTVTEIELMDEMTGVLNLAVSGSDEDVEMLSFLDNVRGNTEREDPSRDIWETQDVLHGIVAETVAPIPGLEGMVPSPSNSGFVSFAGRLAIQGDDIVDAIVQFDSLVRE